MNTNSALNSNPYIDEVAANVQAASPLLRKASLNPNIDTLEDVKAASATDNANETDFERNVEDLVEGDGEFELEREPTSDDFSSYDPYKDRQRQKDQEQGRQQQKKQRRLGKVGRRQAPEPTREEVFSFLDGLDNMLNNLTENVNEKDAGVDAEFENWNSWFKQEKKAPPAPDSSKVFYVREEFNKSRSPHLWKSNPDRKWVLAFGNSPINNVVSTNLYKYQNDTISKDA